MEIQPIAKVTSVFESRFGTPRQPGLVKNAEAYLDFLPPYNDPDAIRGLAGVTHLWLIFGFHATPAHRWRATVRPPRLGGNRRLGVFATRSPFRPNRLGLSVVNLLGIEHQPVRLKLGGVDLMNETPIYDIKPYLPEIDSHANAVPPAGFELPMPQLPVHWPDGLLAQLKPWLAELIEQTIAADPRPAYHRRRPQQIYGMTIAGHEVRWQVNDEQALINTVTPL